MVGFRVIRFLFILILCSFSLAAQDIHVSASIDLDIEENSPLRGVVTVTHPEDSKVDDTSFILEGKPLKTSFVKETKISQDSPIVITIYRFELPGKAKGLYFLPEVSVKVEGKTYRSYPSSYEVRAVSTLPSVPSTSSQPTQQSTENVVLKLEAEAKGKSLLYPGERVLLIYRFYFSGNISLTREELPLLDAKGFLKIGDKDIKDYTSNGLSVREISQMVEAVKPGEYSFGPSIIEGRAYIEGLAGHKIYSDEVLKSEAATLKLTVKPFPKEQKPTSFNGAIGQFTFDVSLASSPNVQVGDEMTLSVEITGKERLNSASLPEMCCQPGFSGFFRLSDLPSTSEIKGDTKRFVVKLRPLTDLVQKIPSIEFSYFDPSTEKYITLHSQPIPIQVRQAKPLPIQNLDIEKKAKEPVREQKQKAISPEAIETLGSFPLTSWDLYNKLFGSWWIMAVIPLGIGFLIYQNNLRSRLLKSQETRPYVSSTELFDRAFKEQKETPLFFDLLNKSFKQALVEIREIQSPDIATEDLPNIGLSGEVRAFLSSIDERRFTGQGKVSPAYLHESARTLFEKILRENSK